MLCCESTLLICGSWQFSFKGTLHPFALSFVSLETILLDGLASFHHFPLRRERSVPTFNASCFKLSKMTIFASFKAGRTNCRYRPITDHCQWVGLRGVCYKQYREYTGVNLRYGTDFHVTV